MKNLKEILEGLKQTFKETNLKVSDEKIAEIGSKIFISNNISNNKQGNKEGSQSSSSPVSNLKPTEKQLSALRGYAIPFDEKTITKKLATKLIGDYHNSKNKEKII